MPIARRAGAQNSAENKGDKKDFSARFGIIGKSACDRDRALLFHRFLNLVQGFSERFRIGRKLHSNTSWGNDFPMVLRRIPFSFSNKVRHSDPLVSLSFGRTAVFLLQISTAPAWVPEEDDTWNDRHRHRAISQRHNRMLRIQRISPPTVYRRQQQNSQHPIILFEQFLLHEGSLPHRFFRRWSGQRTSGRPAICAGKDNSWDL